LQKSPYFEEKESHFRHILDSEVQLVARIEIFRRAFPFSFFSFSFLKKWKDDPFKMATIILNFNVFVIGVPYMHRGRRHWAVLPEGLIRAHEK
jgi:hypothetical protein